MLTALKFVELMLTFAVGVIAIAGETAKEGARWRSVKLHHRITCRGWIAIGCLAALLLTSSATTLVSVLQKSNAEWIAYRGAMKNVCWVIVEDVGAKKRYDYFRSNKPPYPKGGKTPFEAVKIAQEHNTSVVALIDNFGQERTNIFIHELETLLEEKRIYMKQKCDEVLNTFYKPTFM